jgi:hypothetical protein
MRILPRLALLAAPFAVLLQACAVETSSTSNPSDEGSASAASAGATDKTDLVIPRPIPRCEAPAVATTGSMSCAGNPISIYGSVSGTSDTSYATSCAGRASFSATVPECGTANPWEAHQSLEVEVISSLNGSTIPAATCAASYIDYTISLQSATTQEWTTQSARVYGAENGGRCSLSASLTVQNSTGPDSVVAVAATADSYEDIIAPSFNQSFPQAVTFVAQDVTE